MARIDPADEFDYSFYYADDKFEYRHVILPRRFARENHVGNRLLHESEWKRLGVRMSRGWTNYAIHPPEKHILLFKRLKNFPSLPAHVQETYMQTSEEDIRTKNYQYQQHSRVPLGDITGRTGY
ncbi:hypothetical protein BSKO_10730 [Bryopsis sp. KO-2023]|nr:hypothetical protein BSKO_10730 [Bryopsis sp. KO-2023]